DCQRLVNNDRNVFAACMVALGHADGMVTGVTRNWTTAYEDVRKVLDARPRRRVIGVSIALSRGRAVLVADVAVHDMPDSAQLADIAEEGCALPVASAWIRALPFSPIRRLAIRAASARTACARPFPSSIGARSISSTTATWRPTWRSIGMP